MIDDHELVRSGRIDDQGVDGAREAIQHQVLHAWPGHLELLIDAEVDRGGGDGEQVVARRTVVNQCIGLNSAGVGQGHVAARARFVKLSGTNDATWTVPESTVGPAV